MNNLRQSKCTNMTQTSVPMNGHGTKMAVWMYRRVGLQMSIHRQFLNTISVFNSSRTHSIYIIHSLTRILHKWSNLWAFFTTFYLHKFLELEMLPENDAIKRLLATPPRNNKSWEYQLGRHRRVWGEGCEDIIIPCQSTWSWNINLTHPGSLSRAVAQNGQAAWKPRQPCGMRIDAQYLEFNNNIKLSTMMMQNILKIIQLDKY